MSPPGKIHAQVSHPPVNNISIPMRIQFDESFCEMIKSATVTNRISWLLFKYRVQDEMEVGDVICEAYSRAIKNLAAGKEIANVPGWLRSTAHNIVREKFRSKEQQKKLQDRLVQDDNFPAFDQNVMACTLDQPQIQELWARLDQLKPIDQKILILQAQGRSLQQIATQLVKDRDCHDSDNLVANITKRASRARKKLRQDFGNSSSE